MILRLWKNETFHLLQRCVLFAFLRTHAFWCSLRSGFRTWCQQGAWHLEFPSHAFLLLPSWGLGAMLSVLAGEQALYVWRARAYRPGRGRQHRGHQEPGKSVEAKLDPVEHTFWEQLPHCLPWRPSNIYVHMKTAVRSCWTEGVWVRTHVVRSVFMAGTWPSAPSTLPSTWRYSCRWMALGSCRWLPVPLLGSL